MFDKYLIKIINRPLDYLAKFFVKLHISANAITLINIVTSALVLLFLSMQYRMAALVFVICNRVLDGVDGAVARRTNTKTISGGFLDIIVDYVFYAAVPVGIAISDIDAFGIYSILVLSSFLISGVMFMASSSAAAKLSLQSVAFSQKSLYYPVNFIEGGETIVFCIFSCIFYKWYHIFACVIAGLLFLTAPFRAYMHFKNFKAQELKKASIATQA